MWTRNWLRRTRSVKIFSADATRLEESAIANQEFALEDVGSGIICQDNENDGFVMIYADRCNRPDDAADTLHVDVSSTTSCPENDSQQLVEECEEASTCRKRAHLLELCGRSDHNHTCQDLRSASQASKRDKTTRQKYYSFRHVKLGDFDALHGHSAVRSDDSHEAMSEGRPRSKSELYRQAQLPPRPPKNHHRHRDKIYGTISQRVDIRREDRKHSKAIMEGHLRAL
jgi:hypothetical protein